MNSKRNFNWQTFDERGAKFKDSPKISLLEHGGFSFNTSFGRRYFIDKKPKYIRFFYDEDSDFKYIGFSFTDDEKIPGVHKIYFIKENYGTVGCVAFLTKHHIDYKEKDKGQYTPEETNDKELGKLFFISIRK